MIRKLRDIYWKFWLKKYNCKYANGLSTLDKNNKLIIEENVQLARVSIESKSLKIGAYTYVRSGCQLLTVSKVGRYCSISNNVIIGLNKHEHPLDWLSVSLYNKKLTQRYHEKNAAENLQNTIIGNDCWIGRDVIIMSGITIGNGVIIGARSVVTKDVPAYAIVAGSPAKVIRYRFSEQIIHDLQQLMWWNFSEDILQDLDFAHVEKCIFQLKAIRKVQDHQFKLICLTNNKAKAL